MSNNQSIRSARSTKKGTHEAVKTNSCLNKSKIEIFNQSMALMQILKTKSFEGYQERYTISSLELLCETTFSIYLPPQAEKAKVPVLYLLGGSASTEQSYSLQSGCQRFAAKHGICIVCPDTSPRNVDIPGQYDYPGLMGDGAGFYVNATKRPWCKHYRMFSYVTSELIQIVNKNFPVISNKQSISGYSMGGHGSLVCALKNPGLYCSVSAVAPLSNPVKVEIGHNTFRAYFGDNVEVWREWDSTELVTKYIGPPIELLIDQGTADIFYTENILLPDNLVVAAETNDFVTVTLRMREGYDHSYYFVSTVMEEHMEYHSKFLKH